MKVIVIAGMTALMATACAQVEKKPEVTVVEAPPAPTKAQALLKAAKKSKIKGMIHFTEVDGKIKVETMIEGLKAGPHGFHIHETGDCSAPDFNSAGGHFNPDHTAHGSPEATPRHAGDLGNLVADKKMKANTTILVSGLTLKPGLQSIIGKAVIIHQDKDDLKSQPAGNAGKRIACGVIEAL